MSTIGLLLGNVALAVAVDMTKDSAYKLFKKAMAYFRSLGEAVADFGTNPGDPYGIGINQ